jgi:hypothetical protein
VYSVFVVIILVDLFRFLTLETDVVPCVDHGVACNYHCIYEKYPRPIGGCVESTQ